jgi:hypothetical protein
VGEVRSTVAEQRDIRTGLGWGALELGDAPGGVERPPALGRQVVCATPFHMLSNVEFCCQQSRVGLVLVSCQQTS